MSVWGLPICVDPRSLCSLFIFQNKCSYAVMSAMTVNQFSDPSWDQFLRTACKMKAIAVHLLQCLEQIKTHIANTIPTCNYFNA